MKTTLHMLCAILLASGCSRRESEPIRIKLAGPDRLVTGGVSHSRDELRTALRDRVRKHGMDNLIIFEVPADSVYSNIVPTLDILFSCGFPRYQLAVHEDAPGEEFWSQPGDGPRSIDVDVDFVTGQIFIDGARTSQALASVLHADTSAFHRVWIMAADTTTVSQLIKTLEICNKHHRVLPLIVPREDRIAK